MQTRGRDTRASGRHIPDHGIGADCGRPSHHRSDGGGRGRVREESQGQEEGSLRGVAVTLLPQRSFLACLLGLFSSEEKIASLSYPRADWTSLAHAVAYRPSPDVKKKGSPRSERERRARPHEFSGHGTLTTAIGHRCHARELKRREGAGANPLGQADVHRGLLRAPLAVGLQRPLLPPAGLRPQGDAGLLAWPVPAPDGVGRGWRRGPVDGERAREAAATGGAEKVGVEVDTRRRHCHGRIRRVGDNISGEQGQFREQVVRYGRKSRRTEWLVNFVRWGWRTAYLSVDGEPPFTRGL
ncbi:hypothetical protein THAOC_02665 [Thalassiosira oceanica]|uniref:Uncharacterized protein n=1 Tax=Thalassiosira oceanica TaxID=159749 RepID=K0TLT9_THAOC|nr:hypothetical protein THAOC_02665 [Thalassiosira oceanica]|eukprot:EJK75606.1 hypothetical protein THAOC_02665 [Thalassiosira oceanica]